MSVRAGTLRRIGSSGANSSAGIPREPMAYACRIAVRLCPTTTAPHKSVQVNTITPVESRTEETEAIDLMKLLGRRVRGRLLQELGRSDRRVQELASLLAQPQNLVSYHLGLLRAGHVISEHRGYTDGRDVYYSLDLDHLQLMIERAVGAIHPVLPPCRPRLARTAAGQRCRKVPCVSSSFRRSSRTGPESSQILRMNSATGSCEP